MSSCMKKFWMFVTLVTLVVLTAGIMSVTSFAASAGKEGEDPGRFKLYTGFTATDGYDNPNGQSSNENYAKLVDGDKDTKYCTVSYSVPAIFCEFTSESAFYPTGYVFTTARDADDFPRRNPISWTLFGKTDETSDWEVLSKIDNDDTIGAKSKQDYTFSISPADRNGKNYKIFKLQIRALKEEGYYPEFQLAEFQMIGQDTKTTPITEKAATCTEAGYKRDCYLGYDDHFYEDADMQNRLSDDAVIDPIKPHDLQHVAAKDATETQDGNIEYYYCGNCGKKFSDVQATNEIENYAIVRYIDADGTMKYLQPDDYSLVTPGKDNWGTADGEDFLVVPAGEVAIDNYALIKNHVHLILCDGATLNVTGIEVPSRTRLEIHSQSNGENQGYLHSTGIASDADAGYGCCGIGTTRSEYTGSMEVRTGDIKIHGGKIYAKGSEGAPGISVGGYSLNAGDTGNLIINGGEITAEGGSGAAGIGQREVRSNSGEFTMNGGKLTARAGQGKDVSIGTTHNRETNGIAINFKGGELVADGSIGGEKDSVSLAWTSGSDSITAGAFKYPGKVQVKKRFVYDSDKTKEFDPEDYTKDAKIIPVYVVTFNPNNGDDAFKQIIMPGSKVVKPADPQVKPKDGTHYFAYWVDAATDEEYNFETTTPDSDLNIYAKWIYYDPIQYYDPESGTYQSVHKYIENNVDLTPKTTEISATGSETKWVFAYGTFDLKETLNIKGDVRMILFRGARINAKKGIRVNTNGSLTIYANVKEGDDIGRLSATGYSDGEAEGIRTAGISLETTLAPNNEDAVLKVCGGNIYAKGAGGTEGGAAGIGGDRKASGGTTLIYHGSVDADSSIGAAGIGSGYAYDGSDTTTVKIFGGKVDVGDGSASASGIGGGAYSRDKVDIDITGGTVHAIGGQEGAGIGTGRGHRSASATTIDITGASVTAETGNGGATIGSGAAATADVKIDLKNADMTCVATYDATGIGTGRSSSANVDISISNSDIGMNLWGQSFGVGTGSNSNGKATVSITDGSKIAVDTCTRFINCEKPESSTDPDLFIDKSELKITDGAAAEGGIYGDEAVVKDSKINMKSGVCINATESTNISGSTIRQEYQSGIQENQKGIGIGHAGSTVTIDSSDIALEGKSGIAGENVTIDHSAVAVEASGTLDTDELKGCGIYAADKAELHDSQFTLSGACGIYSADKIKAGDCDLAITAPKSIRADKAELKNTPLTATGASVVEAVTALDIDGSTVKNTDPEAEFLLHAPEVSITGGSDVTAFSGSGTPIGGGTGDFTTTKLTVTDSKVTAEGPVAIGNSSAQITAKDSEIYATGNDENAAAISANKAVFRDTDIVTVTDGTGIQAADIDIINGKLDIGGDTGMGQNGAVIKLGWTRKDMEIKTKSYFGTVKISRPFVYKDTGAQIAEAGHYDDVKIAKNKTIIPDAAVVTYIDADGSSQTVNDFTYVTNETTELSDGWYVIKGEVTIPARLNVSGSASLILTSGAKATIEKGIEVNSPNSLRIYGDTLVKDEVGSLELSSNGKDSPLGASEGEKLGVMYIFGGKIKAVTGTPEEDPYNVAAAIGAAVGGQTNGLMYFRHAFVTAENEFGAAIGGSRSANPEGIEIVSGEINASVAKNGMAAGVSEVNYKGDAIGSGGLSTSFAISIYGGTVRAYNGAKGAAIGADKSWPGVGLLVDGGTVYARANKGPGIGLYANSEGRIWFKEGNVYASSSEAAGIGPAGHDGSIPLELEWTELSDSIYASSYENVNVTYNNDKHFKYKDTGAAVDTASTPAGDRTIVPADDSVPEDPKMKDGEYVIPADKATAGTADSGYDKLVDGDKDTKWTVSLSDGPAYCEFEEISPVIPKGYILTTADNARGFLEKNPSAWKLKARAGEDDEWETLDTVEGSERLTPSNERGFIFRVDSRKEYKYFRFEIDGALKGDTAQLAELEIFGPKVEDPAQLKASETRVRVGTTANLSEIIEKQKGDISYSIVEKGTGCSVDPDTGVFTAGDRALDKVTVKITIADGEYTTGKTLELNVKVTEKAEHPLAVMMGDFTYRDTVTDPVFDNPIPDADPVITYSGMLGNGSLYEESPQKPTEAGAYLVKVRIEGTDDAYEGTATFKIDPVSVYINWDSDNQFVYDYEWHYPKAYTADDDLAAMMREDGVSISAARGERSKGEYKIPAVLDGTKKYNYTITNPDPPGTNMTIGSYVNTSVEWADDGSWATAHFKLTPGTKTKDVAGVIIPGGSVEPTCIEDGWVKKTAVFPEGETPWMSDDKTITLHDPDAHDFTDPVYKWSADSSMANAKAECRLCGYKPEETVDTTERVITPPTSTTEGEKEVTATFTKAPFTVQTKRVVIPKREDEARAEERIAAAAAANDSADHEVSAAATKIATAEGAIGIAQTAKAEAEAAAEGDPYEAVNKASDALSKASQAQAAAKDALAAAQSAKAKAESAQSEAAEAVTAARLTGDEDLIAAANAQKDRADGLVTSAVAKIDAATEDLSTADALVTATTNLLKDAVERIAGDQDLAEAVADATNALGQAQAANTVTEGNAQLAERSRQQAAEAAKTPGAAAVTAAQSALTDANAYKSAADEAAGLAATALEKAQAAYDMAVEKDRGAEVLPLLTAAQTAKDDADQAVIAAATAVTNAEAALEDAKAKAAGNAEECIAEAKTACDSAENANSAADTKIAATKDAINTANAAKAEAEEAAQGSDLMAAVNKASLALNAANTAQTEAEKALAAANSAKDDADAAKDKAAAALAVAISTGDEDLIAAANAQVARAADAGTAAAAKVDTATSDLSTAKAYVNATQQLLEDAVEKISDDQELIAAIVEASNAVGKAETANTVTENNAEKAEKSRKDAEQAAKTPGDAAVAAAGNALKDAEAYKSAANEAAGLAATALEKAQAAYDTAVAKGKEADVAPLLAEAQKAKQDADKAAAAADQAVKNAEAALADAKAKAEEAKKKDARKTQKGQDGTYFGKGAALEAAEAALGVMNSNKDPNGTNYLPLRLRSTRQTKTSIKLTWNMASGAKKYVVFGNLNGKSNKMKKLTTTASRSFNVKKIAGKLKKGKYYKFMVIATDGNNDVVSSSKIAYVATKGVKKASNPKGVKVTKPKNRKAVVKKGKTYKIKAAITKAKKAKVKKCAALRYASSNPAVATVTSKGRIRGVQKGSAKIYVYAQNGLMKTIRVTVK